LVVTEQEEHEFGRVGEEQDRLFSELERCAEEQNEKEADLERAKEERE
jgi:hypothetical protein